MRSLLAKSGIIVASGADNGIGARVIEQAGFSAIYMTGAGPAMARSVNAAFNVGADIAFVEATQTREEAERGPRRVRGVCLPNMVEGGRTPVLDVSAAECMGYKLAIVPGLLSSAVIEAVDAALAALKSTRIVPSVASSVGEIFRRFGADDWDRLRRRFNAGANAIGTDAPAVGIEPSTRRST